MVLLRTLGRLTLFDDGDRPIAVPPKPLALLAYLAAARPHGPQRRDALLALLYPEADAHHGRMALRRLLLEARDAAGANVLQALDREQLRLNDTVIDCDLWRLEAAMAAGDAERAADMYAGPFLAGFHLGGAPAFEDWLSAERDRLQRAHADTVERLAASATERGDLEAGATRWRQLVECEPYAGRATLGLMRALAAIGDLGGALEAAHAHAERRRTELDAAPSEEVEELAGRLRAGTVRPATHPRDPVDAPPEPAMGDPPAAPPAGPRRRWRRAAAGLAAAVAILSAGNYTAAWLVATGHPRTLIGAGVIEPGDRVLLAEFTNLTDDPTIADAVREGLRAMLNEPRIVHLVDPAGERNVLERMGRSAGVRLADAVAREAAEREQAKAFLTGQVSRLGSGYQFTVRAVRTSDEAVLLIERETARYEGEVIPALDRLGRRLRRDLGESLRRVRAAPALPRVSTASLPALRAFALADRIAGAFQPGAIPLLEKAIAEDSGFAAAWVLLGSLLGNAGRAGEARDAHDRAFALRERLPEVERLIVEAAHYHRPGSYDRAERIWARVLALDPDANMAMVYLSDIRLQQRRWAEAESLAMRAIARGATNGFPFWNALEAEMALGRFAAAESMLGRLPAGREQLTINVRLGRRDWDGAQRYLDSLHGGYLWDRVTLAVVRGRLMDGARQSPTGLGQRLWWPLIAARYTGDAAWAAHGIDAVLDDAARTWDSTPRGRRPYPALIAALAEVGRLNEARRALAEWRADSTDPRLACDTSRAVGDIARAEGKFERAADAYLAWHRAPFCGGTHVVNRGLFEAGTAYDQAGRGDDAIALYERALSLHSLDGLTYEAAWYPLVLRRLGELHAARGEHARAMAYYGRFLDLWRDADPMLQPQVKAVARRITLAGAR